MFVVLDCLHILHYLTFPVVLPFFQELPAGIFVLIFFKLRVKGLQALVGHIPQVLLLIVQSLEVQCQTPILFDESATLEGVVVLGGDHLQLERILSPVASAFDVPVCLLV
mmetsp:Transcript_38427/g.36786  ORF Transcript_38427/g.36786 Transcript_38427/m.36786 type:complete len:110 (+) Transcript_38427:367-696(+)